MDKKLSDLAKVQSNIKAAAADDNDDDPDAHNGDEDDDDRADAAVRAKSGPRIKAKRGSHR